VFEPKALPCEAEAALELAERCLAEREPEEAESLCLDVLAIAPGNDRAALLLVRSRLALLDHARPEDVERARQALTGLSNEYDRLFYGGVLCTRRAKHQLRQRGAHSGASAYDSLRRAMEHFEAAARLAPESPEPVARWNACVRLIARHPACQPHPDRDEEHGIE